MKKSFITIAILALIFSFSRIYAQVYQGQTSGKGKKAPTSKPKTTKPTPVQPVAVQPSAKPTVAPVASKPVKYVSSPAPRQPRSVFSGGNGFRRGDKLLNLGVGLSSYYYGNPIGLSYEAGVSDDISVGAQFDYNSGNYDGYYTSNYRWGYSAYYLGVRGSYHVNKLFKINEDKVDLYAGIGLGYQRFRWDDSSYGYGYGYGYSYGSGLFFNYFIGGKYYFTPKIGAFVELGYTGLSSSRVGLTVKF